MPPSFIDAGRDTPARTGDPLVPNQVRYQLRHIPIGRKGRKKIWLISEIPLSLHSLSGAIRRRQPLSEAGPACKSDSKAGQGSRAAFR